MFKFLVLFSLFVFFLFGGESNDVESKTLPEGLKKVQALYLEGNVDDSLYSVVSKYALSNGLVILTDSGSMHISDIVGYKETLTPRACYVKDGYYFNDFTSRSYLLPKYADCISKNDKDAKPYVDKIVQILETEKDVISKNKLDNELFYYKGDYNYVEFNTDDDAKMFSDFTLGTTSDCKESVKIDYPFSLKQDYIMIPKCEGYVLTRAERFKRALSILEFNIKRAKLKD
ncbi:hypothetical protein DCO58_04775 [Helicobacter saguini]|uniref:Uncharacterized protein n=1 Tax=Helicobacter saguini TaxID=1548018 RepID=A0A347VSW7_9HELI|nr:hypothetical protein [Helicobacter saguini]MWV62336.1 hypothetical protein [Helicobacter saguini]MWV66993.1 hypothetical protein [Helicobacter saguini]MWV69341.1 hypothetical protein [Helicobacter saguini]MWV71104.1 hypothetical protein [Helicobacter saguini]TLD95000.1 hypothetical protein LS64_003540 [Helicobacter saguini]